MRSMLLKGALAVMALSATACVSTDKTPPVETETTEQNIINGQLDTTRQAVVALFGNGSACSATIIQTDPARGIGWALTAAHCVDDDPQVIVQANDYNRNPQIQYQVIDFESHPAYDPRRGTGFDFAVVRFAGASNATPVIPIPTGADGMGRGSQITSVGYGRTTPSNQNGGQNTVRRRFSSTLTGTTEQLLVYNLSQGGICSGDSGGPVLAQVGGVERVVGVHSSVTGDCRGEGFNGRVQGVYTTWLRGVLTGQPEESCELCQQIAQSGTGACTGAIDNCTNSQACQGFLGCIQNCGNNADCQGACVSNNREGLREYQAIFDCICDDACAAICEGDDLCPEGAACGLAFADETCNGCLEGSCCAPTEACSGDDTCLDCISGNADASVCRNNAAFNNMFECLENSCGEECGLDNECGFSNDGACGTCITNTCCAEGAACADNDTCTDCVTGNAEDPSVCQNNAELEAFIDCLGGECLGDPCGVNGDPNPDPNPDGNPDANPGVFNPDPNPDANPGANNPDPNPGPGGFVGPGDDEPDGFVGEADGFVGGGGSGNAVSTGPCTVASGHTPADNPLPGLVLLALGAFAILRR